MKDEPVHLTSDPDAPSDLRDLLEAGRAELPDDAQLSALAAKVGLAGAVAGAGALEASGAGAGASATTGKAAAGAVAATKAGAGALAVKAALALAVASGAVAGAYALSQGGRDEEVRAPATASLVETDSAPPSVAPARSAAPPPEDAGGSAEPEPPEPPRRAPAAVRLTPSSLAPSSAPAEVPLIRGAQDALVHGNYRDALRDAERHAVAHPRGVLVQEREVIAIEALAGLGRREEARTRAERFRAAYPTSPHVRRIDAILAGATP